MAISSMKTVRSAATKRFPIYVATSSKITISSLISTALGFTCGTIGRDPFKPRALTGCPLGTMSQPDLPLLKLLSVVIPARDEEGSIGSTIDHLRSELSRQGIPHEIIVVDDHSTDATWAKLMQLA